MKWFNLTEQQQKYLTSRIKACCENVSEDFHTQSTPFSLCVEMVGKLNIRTFESGEWLVIANLEFLVVLKEYFKFRGWKFENVSFATPCDIKGKFAKFLGVGKVHKYSYENFKEWNLDMKFDVVIGNPPYQNGYKNIDSKSSSHLWPEFIELSFNLTREGGFISLVTPPSWLGPGKKLLSEFAKRKTLLVNLKCGHHFKNVGSAFSYFIVNNTLSDNTLTHFENEEGGMDLNLSGLKFAPLRSNSTALSIVQKTLLSNNKKLNMIISNENRYDNPDARRSKSETHCFEVKNTNKASLWFSKKPSNYNLKKVIINATGTYNPFYDDGNTGTSHNMKFIVVKDEFEGKNLEFYVKSKLIQFVLDKCRYSGAASNEVYLSIPFIDYSNTLTDQIIYNHFNLTTEEIQLIEGTIK